MRHNISEMLQRLLFLVVTGISIIIVLTYILSMGLGILVVFSTSEGLSFTRELLHLYPLLVIDIPVAVNAGLYFLLLWWAFALCFAAAWKYRESLTSKLRRFFAGSSDNAPFSNNLLSMPVITSMLLLAMIALDSLQSGSGIPTGSPTPSEPFLDLVRFSRAPLVEEILFRVIPIGTFLVTYVYVFGKGSRPEFSLMDRLKACALSVFQPESAKEIVGLRTIRQAGLVGGISWAEWTIVLLTSAIFGVAHFYGGWGPGKISQAAMSGAVFALAYLYYGIQAPILLHWFFNYYFTVLDMSSIHYSIDFEFAYSMAISANFLLGLLMWLAVGLSCLMFFYRKIEGKSESQSLLVRSEEAG